MKSRASIVMAVSFASVVLGCEGTTKEETDYFETHEKVAGAETVENPAGIRSAGTFRVSRVDEGSNVIVLQPVSRTGGEIQPQAGRDLEVTYRDFLRFVEGQEGESTPQELQAGDLFRIHRGPDGQLTRIEPIVPPIEGDPPPDDAGYKTYPTGIKRDTRGTP